MSVKDRRSKLGETLLVAGRSMEPTLRVGETVRVEPTGGPFHVGEVVVIRTERPPYFICHRLVASVRLPGIGHVHVHRGDDARSLPALALGHRVVGRILDVHRGEAREPVERRHVSRATRLASLAGAVRTRLRARRRR